MIGLAGLAGYAGWTLARDEPQGFIFEAVRFLLLAACGLSVAGPIMMPGGDRTNAVRLLLLPILFALLTRPGQYAGMDWPNRALAWMAIAGVMTALALVHVLFGRQLLALGRGERNHA